MLRTELEIKGGLLFLIEKKSRLYQKLYTVGMFVTWTGITVIGVFYVFRSATPLGHFKFVEKKFAHFRIGFDFGLFGRIIRR